MNWKKGLGLYAAYRIGRGGRTEARGDPGAAKPARATRGTQPLSIAAILAYVVLGLGLTYLLIKLGV